MNEEHVRVEVEDGVATVWLERRPPRWQLRIGRDWSEEWPE
jgi:hypothetical protein